MMELRTLFTFTIGLVANLYQVCEGTLPPYCDPEPDLQYFCTINDFLPGFGQNTIRLDAGGQQNIVDFVDPSNNFSPWCSNVPLTGAAQAGLQVASGVFTVASSVCISGYPQSILDDFANDIGITWAVAITNDLGCTRVYCIDCFVGSTASIPVTNATLCNYTVPMIPDCAIDPWETWSNCTQNCDGTRTRTRTFNDTDPAFGCNIPDPSELMETEDCTDFCETCNHTEWSDFSNCSKPCVGHQVRTRMNLDNFPNCEEVSEEEKRSCASDCVGYSCTTQDGIVEMTLFTYHSGWNYVSAINYTEFVYQNITYDPGTCNYTDADNNSQIEFTLSYNASTGEPIDPPDPCGRLFEPSGVGDGFLFSFAFKLKFSPELDVHEDTNVYFSCDTLLNTVVLFDANVGPPINVVLDPQAITVELGSNVGNETVYLGDDFYLYLRLVSDTGVQLPQRVTFASLDYCDMRVTSDPVLNELRIIEDGCGINSFFPGYALRFPEGGAQNPSSGEVEYRTATVPLKVPPRVKPGVSTVVITCVIDDFCFGGFSNTDNIPCYGTNGMIGFPTCGRRKRAVSEFKVDKKNSRRPRLVETEFTVYVEEGPETPEDSSKQEQVQYMRVVILSSMSAGFIVVIIILSILLVFGIRRRRRIGKKNEEKKKSISSRSPPPPYSSY